MSRGGWFHCPDGSRMLQTAENQLSSSSTLESSVLIKWQPQQQPPAKCSCHLSIICWQSCTSTIVIIVIIAIIIIGPRLTVGRCWGFFFGRRNATLILSQRRQSPSASAASTAQPPDRNGMSKTSNQTSTDDQIGAGCRPISAGPANGTCFYSGPSGRLISCSCCQSLGRVEQPLNRSLMHIWTDNRRRQVRAPLLVPMMAL